MSEAMRKYEHLPQNDNGDDEVITLNINSSLTKTNESFDKLRPRHFTDSFANDGQPEDEMFEFDPSSIEKLDEIKDYLLYLKEQIADFTAAGGLKEASSAKFAMLQQIGEQISDVYDLLRYQNEDLVQDANEEVIQQRGERIGAALGTLLETFDTFTQSIGESEVEVQNDVPKKTGWWDKDFQETQGVTVAGTEGGLRQVWGESDGPIGFEPSVIEKDGEKERHGWWKDEYLEQKGIERTSLGELNHVQPGDVGVIADSDQFVSRPVAGERKGQVKWSLRDLNDIAVKESERTADVINDTPLSEEEKSFVPIVSETKVDLANEYETARKSWLEAKALHETKHKEYNDAVKAYYESLSEQGFLSKNLTRLKSSFGFKPQLPPEIAAMREEMFAATALYNQQGRIAATFRYREGKKNRQDISEKVIERYNRLLARTLVLNTFNTQRELQSESVEDLQSNPSKFTEFFKENRKAIRLAGAATVGALTGGVVPAGMWWVRSTFGAAASATAVGFVGKKMDSYVDNVKLRTPEEIKSYVHNIEELLTSQTLTAEDLESVYKNLSNIYGEVDTATRRKILAMLATAMATGMMVGGAVGAVGEEVFGIDADLDGGESREDIRTAADDRLSREGVNAYIKEDNVLERRDEIVSGGEAKLTDETAGSTSEAIAGDVNAAPVSEDANVSEIVEKSSEHTVEKGDTMWKYLKEMGYSDADTMKVINGLDDAQLKDVGFGIGSEIDADKVMAGATVDLEKLKQFAESITESGEVAGAEEISQVGTTSEAVSAEPQSKIESVPETSQAKLAKEIYTNGSLDSIMEYRSDYKGGVTGGGGHAVFEADFQKQFVENIQGPPPAKGGSLLDFLFGGKPNTTNAFVFFSGYSVSDFKELATLEETTLVKELNENNIDIADYQAWKKALMEWKASGMVIKDNEPFGRVAERAFINSYEQVKVT